MKNLLLAAAVAAVSFAPLATAQSVTPLRTTDTVLGSTALGGQLYYYAGDGYWRTDGTVAGTQNLVASQQYEPMSLVACNDLVFSRLTSGYGGLGRTDGTAAGTFGLPSRSGVDSMACVGRTLYFATYGSSPLRALWKTDGTAAGTFLVKDGLGAPKFLQNVRGTLMFANGSKLMKSDGTTAGTVAVQELPDIVDSALAIGSRYFATAGNGRQLWASDGTAAGTQLLSASSTMTFLPLVAAGGNAYFFRDGLGKSDGTLAGTTSIRYPMRTSAPERVIASSGSRIYFRGADSPSTVDVLWKSDGTAAGTSQLASLSGITLLADADGLLVAGSDSGTSVTNGTAAPAVIAADRPTWVTKAGTHAFFGIAEPGYASRGLYVFDLGFAASTLSPNVVAMAGGTTVTLTGAGFDASTTLTVDGAAVTPASVSPTSLTFAAPAHAQGTFDVAVRSGSGQLAQLTNALTYVCDSAPVAVATGTTTVCQNTPVTLAGSGGATCSWLPPAGLSDPSSCAPVATPASTTTYRLTVTNASGCASTNAADVTVTVNPQPAAGFYVSSPGTFSATGYASRQSSGSGEAVRWTATNAQILSDPTLPSVNFRLLCGAPASLTLTVTSAAGCATSMTQPVVPQVAPAISSVSPNRGLAGSTLTITGNGFTCASAIRYGYLKVSTDFHIDSDTQLTATFPAGASGGKVEVQVAGQWVTGNAATFTLVVPKAKGDFDGDGKVDILFRNPATGLDAVWLMNGTAYASTVNLVSFPSADYHIVGTADFDGDGWNDVVLHNSATGANAIWLLSRFSFIGVVDLPAIPDTTWELEGTGDFNGDGKPDIVFRNQATGANAVWLMNGTAYQSTVDLSALPNGGYRIAGTADFNGDGKADIVWRNVSTGANAVWLMNGTAYVSTLNLPPLPNAAYAIGAVADYNGDGKPDIAWRNASTGANALWLLDGTSLIGTVDLPAVPMPQLEMAGPR